MQLFVRYHYHECDIDVDNDDPVWKLKLKIVLKLDLPSWYLIYFHSHKLLLNEDTRPVKDAIQRCTTIYVHTMKSDATVLPVEGRWWYSRAKSMNTVDFVTMEEIEYDKIVVTDTHAFDKGSIDQWLDKSLINPWTGKDFGYVELELLTMQLDT